MSSDRLQILLIVPLSPLFRQNERHHSFDFQKACSDNFAFYFESRCPSTVKNSFLSLSSAAAYFTSLALNAAKFWISFGRVKRQSQVWRSAVVEEAVNESRKTFTTA